jgi:hypothetical protein
MLRLTPKLSKENHVNENLSDKELIKDIVTSVAHLQDQYWQLED